MKLSNTPPNHCYHFMWKLVVGSNFESNLVICKQNSWAFIKHTNYPTIVVAIGCGFKLVLGGYNLSERQINRCKYQKFQKNWVYMGLNEHELVLNPNYDCDNNKDIIFIVHLVSQGNWSLHMNQGSKAKRVLKIQIPLWLSIIYIKKL